MGTSDSSSGQADITGKRDTRIRARYEFAFALNIACALAYVFLAYLAQFSEMPRNNLRYYFYRSALRLSDLLHGSFAPAVPGGVALRQPPSLAMDAGQEFLILISVLGIAIFLVLLVRLMAGTVVYRMLMNRYAIGIMLLAMPCGWLRLSWVFRPGGMDSSGPGLAGDPVIPTVIFLSEALCLAILAIINEKYALPLWLLGVLLLLHYSFWLWALWPFAPVYVVIRNFGYYSFFLIFVASGFIWLSYLKGTRRNPTLVRHASRPGKYSFIAAGITAVVFLFLWFDRPGGSFSHPKDLDTVKLVMERSPCFGSCPSYSLTVHGSGLVEYSGNSFVLVQGSRTDNISKEQVLTLLQELDRIHFGGLEPRAFDWCFDTPTVAVSISVDGKTKRVASDASCTGARSGPQDQFVTFAQKMDTVTDSKRWWSCGSYCR